MTATADLADQAAPLDALLVDAALGPVRRFAPDLSTARWATSLARKPPPSQGTDRENAATSCARVASGSCCSGSSPRSSSIVRWTCSR